MDAIAPYADLFKNPNGPGDQRPTALQIIKDQGLEGKWQDKVILITGCTSGIGVETARALYETGASIYITARNMEKGNSVAQSLTTDAARPVRVLELSLDSLASVRKAAEQFLSLSSKLNILIDNAGVMACPKGKTVDGFETQWGTNHLGHFLLFQLLKPALLASATPSFASRVISVSSTGHKMVEKIDLDDLGWDNREYEDFKAYGQSKLSNVYFANELDRRYGAMNLHGWSLHPGSIPTELGRHLKNHPLQQQVSQDQTYQKSRKSPEQGAATQVWAACAKELEGKGGKYLEDCQVSPPWKSGAFYARGFSKHAYNPAEEKKLWEVSSKVAGVSND
jgi:NAD(P)-dependent dehydrogenase (short-subunit alcohol dehydrogenase family)